MRPESTFSHHSGRHSSTSAPPVVLTIAGFDPSNGAGITADLQVFAAHGLFGVSAITALTVQSTQGVAAVQTVDPRLLSHTLEHLAADLPIAGIKIGMPGSEATLRAVIKFLGPVAPRPGRIPVVFDPVLRSSSGHELLAPGTLKQIQVELLPRVGWVTPNWAELEFLTGEKIGHVEQVSAATYKLSRRYPALHIVATGGDGDPPVDLLRSPGGTLHAYRGDRVHTTSTHGTGCAFSSALLSRLVLGDSPLTAVSHAKAYVTGALRSAPRIGQGAGPLDLLWPLRAGASAG